MFLSQVARKLHDIFGPGDCHSLQFNTQKNDDVETACFMPLFCSFYHKMSGYGWHGSSSGFCNTVNLRTLSRGLRHVQRLGSQAFEVICAKEIAICRA